MGVNLSNNKEFSPFCLHDELCRVLARCHKCIEQDYGVSAINSEWDANFGKYRWQLGNDGSLSCNNNDDQYKEDLCKCDAAYKLTRKFQNN